MLNVAWNQNLPFLPLKKPNTSEYQPSELNPGGRQASLEFHNPSEEMHQL
jgi:hypothetical protein